jgi:protein-tyrosine phosphatase
LPWTDLHSHILPGFDDGAADDWRFLEMAQVAVRGGTGRMAATPHYDIEKPAFEPQDVAAAVKRYNDLLNIQGLSLVLVPGVEIRINTGLYRMAKDEGSLQAFVLGGKGRYLLVDLPLGNLPVPTPDILFQIQLCGVVPILAHPERNRYLVEHPSALKELIERGVKIQVNSGSLEGIYGKSARRMARQLLKEGVARLVASDAHSPYYRSPDLSGAVKILHSILGKEAPRLLLQENPDRVLEGEDIIDVVESSARSSNKGRFRSRKKTR